MKEMLIICTKNVHFIFNEEVYKQTDDIVMASPLGECDFNQERKQYCYYSFNQESNL